MIEVQGPNGIVIRFPDGTDPETINRVMSEAVAMSQSDADPVFGEKVADVAKSLGSGVARGAAALWDLPGDINQLVSGGATALVNKGIQAFGGEGDLQAPERVLPTARDSLSDYAPGVANYEPQTTTGEYAQTVGEFLPGSALGGGGLLRSAIQYGVVPGIASEAAGQATEGMAIEPYARFAAGLLAPAAPAVAQNVASKVASPMGGVSQTRQASVDVLERAGIPTTAGQKIGSEALMRVEGRTVAGDRLRSVQDQNFTRAVLSKIGQTADEATPEVLNKAADDIGKMFDDAVSGVDVGVGSGALDDVKSVLAQYADETPDRDVLPLFKSIGARLKAAVESGEAIPAATMKKWRSALSRVSARPDPANRDAAVGMISVLDGLYTDAAKAAGRAGDVKKLSDARRMWRDFLIIRQAASRAGGAAKDGLISPASLRGALRQKYKGRYATGAGDDLGEIGRATEAVAPLPSVNAGGVRYDPGTQGMAAAGIGGAAGSALAGPVGGGAGALFGLVAPQLTREAMMTGPVQRYLARNTGIPTVPVVGAGAARTIPGGLLAFDRENQ